MFKSHAVTAAVNFSKTRRDLTDSTVICLISLLFVSLCFTQEKQTGDWRKNVEDKAGMGGRKKMFETEA